MEQLPHFNDFHSFLWVHQVEAWFIELSKNPYIRARQAVKRVSFERVPLQHFEGEDSTPLMTALLYALSMGQEMQKTNDCLRRIAPLQLELEKRIADETKAVTDGYVADAAALTSSSIPTPYSMPNMPHDQLSFSEEEAKALLQTRPTTGNIDSLIEEYMRARLASEYQTIKAAVTTYHAARSYGIQEINEALARNSIALTVMASAVTHRLIDAEQLKDIEGMRSDHHTERTRKRFSLKNCPVADAYRVVDDYLLQRYGFKAGFAEGQMGFCAVCEEHGQLAARIFTPSFVKLEGMKRTMPYISEGSPECTYRFEGKVNPLSFFTKPGQQRIDEARALLRQNIPVIPLQTQSPNL